MTVWRVCLAYDGPLPRWEAGADQAEAMERDFTAVLPDAEEISVSGGPGYKEVTCYMRAESPLEAVRQVYEQVPAHLGSPDAILVQSDRRFQRRNR